MLQNASLDTSFWNIATRIGVVPYLFAYFKVYYCKAVEREIVATEPNESPLIYPQAMLFHVMKEDGRLYQAEPQRHLSIFGSGEAYAISLAQEKRWTLLINDYRPLQFARSLGITCISVPDFCVLHYVDGKITLKASQSYLRRLVHVTSPILIKDVADVMIEIARNRGEYDE